MTPLHQILAFRDANVRNRNPGWLTFAHRAVFGGTMYSGKGSIVLRDGRVLVVRYQYDRSRKAGVWEGILAGDMRRLERGAFFDAIALICASGTVIDLKITTYSDVQATFKGVTRAPAVTTLSSRSWRPSLQRAGAAPRSRVSRLSLSA